MSRWLARLIVRASAWLAPSELRDRWREEWIAELENDPRSHFSPVLGAPLDALALRRLAATTRDRRQFQFGQWRNDTRLTIRLLLRSPGYVAIVVLGLGIGLTATIAMYSAANAALHGELPGVLDRESLATVDTRLYNSALIATRHGISLSDLPLLQRHGPLVQSVGAQGHKGVTVRFGDDAVTLPAVFASDRLFETLGTTAVIGRVLTPDDDRNNAPVAVIGHRLWRTTLGGRLDVLGETLVVDGQPLRIVGVLPDRFAGLLTSWAVEGRTEWIPQVWMPMALARSWPSPYPADAPVNIGVRLAPGASQESAERDLAPIARALEAAHPRADHTVRIQLRTFVIGDAADDPFQLAGIFALLLAIPFGVLAIACANVANLRLARATARASEWAVRLSLGATRGHLTRLMLIEALLLTGLSLFVAWLGVQVLVTRIASRFLAVSITVDWRVATFAAVVSIVVVGLSGLAPAWLVIRRASAGGLRQAAHSGLSTHSRIRTRLIVVQIALSLVLLASGSLITRSALVAAEARRPNFDQLLVADIAFDANDRDTSRFTRFASDVLSRLAADSRFAAAGLADSVPMGGRIVQLGDEPPPPGSRRPSYLLHVTPGWFDAMSLRPIAGRTLTSSDDDTVGVINEAAARMMTAGRSPIGMTLNVVNPFEQSRIATLTIVGVVPDSTRQTRRPLESMPQIYRLLGRSFPRQLTLYAREAAETDLSTKLQRVLTGIEHPGPRVRVERASSLFEQQVAAYRDVAAAVRALGLLALAMAAAGLFAVMSYTVSLRTREMGVRVALGAERTDIARLVLRQALGLTAIGAGIGFAITLPLAQFLRSILLGVSPLDPMAIGVVVLLFTVTALVAGLLPARRAAAVDPVKALRAE